MFVRRECLNICDMLGSDPAGPAVSRPAAPPAAAGWERNTNRRFRRRACGAKLPAAAAGVSYKRRGNKPQVKNSLFVFATVVFRCSSGVICRLLFIVRRCHRVWVQGRSIGSDRLYCCLYTQPGLLAPRRFCLKQVWKIFNH